MNDLIVFAEDYNGLPSSTQHLIKGLAVDRKVAWINSIGLRQPTFCKKDAKRVIHKLRNQFNSENQHSRGDYSRTEPSIQLSQINLATIPAPQSRLARRLARELMLKQLTPILKRMNLHNPILWTSLPTAADLCGYLGESAVVYYCGDDFSSLAGVDHKTVTEHEMTLVNKANLILTASDRLASKFPNDKTTILTHGVDDILFSTPIAPAPELTTLRAKNNRPIAGFYGSISSWLDYQMLNEIFLSLPDWDFVFIGPLELANNPLPIHDNVHYLGPKPHAQLASFSQHWDVSLLPFKPTAQIQSCNPLKLLEYLAAGKPIVSTPFPALKPYLKHIHCAQDSRLFVNAMIKAKSAAQIPLSTVSNQSWTHRRLFLDSLLEKL